jgi:hypothetical protein
VGSCIVGGVGDTFAHCVSYFPMLQACYLCGDAYAATVDATPSTGASSSERGNRLPLRQVRYVIGSELLIAMSTTIEIIVARPVRGFPVTGTILPSGSQNELAYH